MKLLYLEEQLFLWMINFMKLVDLRKEGKKMEEEK